MSTDLRYTTQKQITSKERIVVDIRLDDECKNGHQDFAITGTIYEGKRDVMGGCIHEEILKAFPEFKIFVTLHLRDYTGKPMHCGANMYFHLKDGLYGSKMTKEKFCEYYIVSESDYDNFMTSVDEIDFRIKLESSNVFNEWLKIANQGIDKLEKLTGEKFVNASQRMQYKYLTIAEIENHMAMANIGYYLPAAIEQRRIDKIEEKVEEMKNDLLNKQKSENIDLELNIILFREGGKRWKENVIYYKYSSQVKLNWNGNKLTPEECETLISFLKTIKWFKLYEPEIIIGK